MKISAIGQSPVFRSVTEVKRAESEKITEHAPLLPRKKHISPVSITGWLGAGSLVTAIFAGIKKMPKLHKIAAYTAVGAVAAHIGIMHSYHHHHQKQNTDAGVNV